MVRPSETIQAAIGALIGAFLVLYGAFQDGFEFNDLSDPEVTGAITVVVGFVAAAVTWWVARKQRAGQLTSEADGKVAK